MIDRLKALEGKLDRLEMMEERIAKLERKIDAKVWVAKDGAHCQWVQDVLGEWHQVRVKPLART